jgi:hypothetical protein
VGSAIHGCCRFSSGALRSSSKRLLKEVAEKLD